MLIADERSGRRRCRNDDARVCAVLRSAAEDAEDDGDDDDEGHQRQRDHQHHLHRRSDPPRPGVLRLLGCIRRRDRDLQERNGARVPTPAALLLASITGSMKAWGRSGRGPCRR
jgi:hypothetical protein